MSLNKINGDIDKAMKSHCLAMAKKMAAPTQERHEYWLQSVLHFADFPAITARYGREFPIEGYPHHLYDEALCYIHFVGENSSHKFFAQKRVKGWVIIAIDSDDEVTVNPVTSTTPYTGKLGWDRGAAGME